MRKGKLLVLLLVGVLVLSFGACTSTPAPTPSEFPSTSASPTESPKPTTVRLGMFIPERLGKTYYTGSQDTFTNVVTGCPVPIVILGGEKPKMRSSFFKTSLTPLRPEGQE